MREDIDCACVCPSHWMPLEGVVVIHLKLYSRCKQR